jgi:general secretion pathway protein K
MKAQRGVALVLVMWIAILLTVIASSFMLEARTDTLVVRNSIASARAEAAADAGVHRALSELYRTDNAPEAWRRDGSRREWAFDGTPVSVELRDESGKIDINTGSDALLRGLLLSAGLNDDESAKLLDAILDWRDADSLKRLNGAEEAEYRAAGLSYKPANATFQAIEELQLVLGMRPHIYRRISPLITVFSRVPGVNTQVASREVLLAIPGVTAQMVDEYIALREQAIVGGQPVPVMREAAAFNAAISMAATIRSEARLEDGTVFVREAVALLRPTPRRPVTFLAWREALPSSASSTETPGKGAGP